MDEQRYFVLKKSESTSWVSITITIATDHNVVLNLGEHVINWEWGSLNLSRKPPSNVVQMVSTVNATKCYQV